MASAGRRPTFALAPWEVAHEYESLRLAAICASKHQKPLEWLLRPRRHRVAQSPAAAAQTSLPADALVPLAVATYFQPSIYPENHAI